MIVIRSKQEGFRRCGIAHSEEPKEYNNDEFTKEQLKELEAEPMLTVKKTPGKKKDETEDK